MTVLTDINPAAQQHVAQLCTNLYVSAEHKPPKRLALTTAERQEGKTDLGLALACQLADLLNVSVLFIEANLRAPALARRIDHDPDRPGFGELLAQTATVDDVVVSLGEQRPDVIPAGNLNTHQDIIRAPTQQNLQQTLSHLDQRYQYLIIETAPVNLYPETQILLPLADAVLLVVRAGTTTKEAAARALKRIELAGAKPPGIVLNRRKFHLPEFLYKRL